MEKAKIDEFLALRLTAQLIFSKGGWGGSQHKRKDFLSKFNFLLNALPAEL